MAPIDDPVPAAPPAPAPPETRVVHLEQFARHIAETVATDVAAAVKADEHYAPLVGALAARVLGALAGV